MTKPYNHGWFLIFLLFVALIYSELSDYSFSSPTDTWPSTYDDSTSSTKSTAFAMPISKKDKGPRPIRTIRKFAGWVFGSTPARNARGFGSQTFL